MLHFLNFEVQDQGTESTTLEAMASVRPHDLPALLNEWVTLGNALAQWLGTAAQSLDLGGVWDCWVQGQWDGAPPATLPPHLTAADALAQLPPADRANPDRWWTLTITLALRTPDGRSWRLGSASTLGDVAPHRDLRHPCPASHGFFRPPGSWRSRLAARRRAA